MFSSADHYNVFAGLRQWAILARQRQEFNLFGAKYITENYGIVFTVYGISSLIATPLAAKILENTGVYDGAFLVGLGFAAVGFICNMIVAGKEKKLRKEQVNA